MHRLTVWQIDLLLPSECYSLIADRLHAALKPLSYRRLVMPLGAILEPVFFDTFIKTGNVLLLSHGRIDVDNVFSLSDGVLRMSLSKNAYEKAGIVGRPSKFGAGPSLKRQRWCASPPHPTPHPHIQTRQARLTCTKWLS